jgi:hypothetical protein
MKLLAALLTLAFASTVMADIPRPNPTPKPQPQGSIYSIIKKVNYDVKMLTPKCGPRAKCIGGTPTANLVLTLSLQGCLDTSIVSYTVKEDPNNSDVKVTVSAINVANPKSKAALCVAPPMETKIIPLGKNASKNVTVELVENLAN